MPLEVIRTFTRPVLSRLPLPIGLQGQKLGRPRGRRIPNLPGKSRMLCQLSYGPETFFAEPSPEAHEAAARRRKSIKLGGPGEGCTRRLLRGSEAYSVALDSNSIGVAVTCEYNTSGSRSAPFGQ